MNTREIEDRLEDAARTVLDCDQFCGVMVIAVDADGNKAHSFSLGVDAASQRSMNDFCDAAQAQHAVIN